MKQNYEKPMLLRIDIVEDVVRTSGNEVGVDFDDFFVNDGGEKALWN
jgi:hypothetical protein